MIGDIFLIKLPSPNYLLALFLVIFAVSVLYLQNLKAPWVDECYSYYGVWHESFTEFYDSMLTGINFSPPLYFLLNFFLQLIFPTSIEQLRIQSLIFVTIGIVLSFLISRKIFGSVAAFFATILVVSQSNLLLSQAQEARHYAMFFACGAWVLYLQSCSDFTLKKFNWLTFIAHFCLCQVHYLGIIFSFLSGVAYFLTFKNIRLWQRIPMSIIICWLVSIVSYLFYLTKQKSVLNTWPKPNEISDLLAGYNNSILILASLIPILSLLLTDYPKKNTEKSSPKKNYCSITLLLTSLFWLALPFIFWLSSNLTPLNLFVDRYFIPKESGLILLVAYGLYFISKKLSFKKSKSIPLGCTLGLGVILLFISTKRSAFGLNKDTNYHHSLIIENSYPTSKQPIILQSDPNYFPNAYLEKNDYLFALENDRLIEVYQRFSSKIQFLKK